MAYLTESGTTIKGLAAKWGVHHNTMAGYLNGPEFEALKADLFTEMNRLALNVLHRATENAARLWADKAVPIAAAKGDHRPARDLLAATGTIDISTKDKGTPNVTVQIGVSLSNLSPVAPAFEIKQLQPKLQPQHAIDVQNPDQAPE